MTQDGDDLDGLRSGEERAFRELYRRYNGSLIRVAMGFVANRATAEEVVQDTWLGVIAGLEKFEGRSSLKNWMFAILANKARSRAVRDSRMISSGTMTGLDEDTPMVDPARFDRRGRWADPPMPWDEITPERVIGGREIWAHLQVAIDALPATQKAVLVMREMEGMDPVEVGAILGISDGNQRVLLHRARSRLRTFLEVLHSTLTAPRSSGTGE